MKITKAMVFAVALIVAALLVAPAAARVGCYEIENGNTIFLNEDSLNLSGFGAVDSLVKLDGSDLSSPVLTVGNESNYDVPGWLTDSQLGRYAVLVGGVWDTTSVVNIQKTQLKLDVVLESDNTQVLTGKPISADDLVQFKIQTYDVGLVMPATCTPTVRIVLYKVDEPDVQYETFGGVDLRTPDIDVTGATFYTDPVDLTMEDEAAYAAYLQWRSPTDSETGAGGLRDAPPSATIDFSIREAGLSITTNKDTVIGGGDFTVTISGAGDELYLVYVEESGVDDDEYPTIVPSVGVTVLGAGEGATACDYADDFAGADCLDVIASIVPDTAAEVETTGAGTRGVKFETTTATAERTFEIWVASFGNADSDSVKVKVEGGDVTITVGGDASFFLGETILLSGTNTDSDDVFLFLTGPNLDSDGVYLDLSDDELDVGGSAATWDSYDSWADVDSSDEWELDFDTAGLDIDAGTYTIYALSSSENKGGLSDATYDSVSVIIKKGFVTATTNVDVVARGDDLTISGTAEGNPDIIWIWVFGKNWYDRVTDVTIEDDGTFEEDYDTADLASGQYFVVVQHPMYNNRMDVRAQLCEGSAVSTCVYNLISDKDEFVVDGRDSLQGSDAAFALVEALNSPNVDDSYMKLDFLVEEPLLTIDAVGDKYVGDVFSLTGKTNLAPDDELLVEVVSASFKPTEKSQSGEFSGDSDTVMVIKGDDKNTWSFELDTTTFKPDEYIIRVESIDTGTTATATFNLLAGAPPTVPPTVVPTTAPVETTAPPATATPEPTPAPGFGALIALIGLGAVAVLVLRKH